MALQAGSFRLSNMIYRDRIKVTLHAYGMRSNAQISEAEALFACRFTDRCRWLSPEIISAIEVGEIGGDGIFSIAFLCELGAFLEPDIARHTTGYMLSELGILAPEMLQGWNHSISFFSSEASALARNMQCRRMFVIVELSIFQVYDFSRESGSFSSLPTLSASSSPQIMDLEEAIEFKEGIREKSCAICLEEVVSGTSVTWMPCSHVYHGDCLAKWLEQASICPLSIPVALEALFHWFRSVSQQGSSISELLNFLLMCQSKNK